MNGDELRQSFVRFFEERGHVELPSLPLIPHDDPSVMFVIAGMQQMIPFFVGELNPPSKRLVSIQKCLRTVDIEEVGDESHLTFFEMLGNFSVGDYFVPEALRFTWEYLTETLRIPQERLWATVFPGDEFARKNWLEIGMPAERICEDPSNWWTRPGQAGPAGPDSEVHYDRGEQYGCGEPDCTPLCTRCHRFVEIWNNVFMDSLVNEKNEVQRELQSKNIDTGQGFDRLLMVVQGVETVYETDVFSPIINAVATSIGKPYKIDPATDKSLRIIADHCRALTMAIADGGMPGNEGRGYVLRRLLRRSVVRGRLLGFDKPFLAESVKQSIKVMSSRYPEVLARQDVILQTIQQEEERFAETLTRGFPMVEELMAVARENSGMVNGQDAFVLHDTYGLPLELIQELAEERGVSVDLQGFDAALQEQQKRGRAGRVGPGETNLENLAALAERIGPTVFTGYEQMETEALVVGIIKDGRLTESAVVGDDTEIVLDTTPFYSESGGQVGDHGVISGDGFRIQVDDTQRPYGGIVVHTGKVLEGSVRDGDPVLATVDGTRRAGIRPHHSATHLIHLALHEVLGAEATQAGSLVAPDRLRFDFRWPVGLTEEQLDRIQTRVNELVFENQPVVTREMPYADAVAAGAMALFGEKYGDLVRMVAMGPSKELCGGTHVTETVEIGPVAILSESGIGSGIRRIEALAGISAYRHFNETSKMLSATAAALGSPPARAPERAVELSEQLRTAERRLTRLSRDMIARQATELIAGATDLNGASGGAKLIVKKVHMDTPSDLHQLATVTLRELGSGIVVLASVIEGKPQFAAAVSSDMEAQGRSAREIAQNVGKVVGGGAGGSPGFAQGGGSDASKLDDGLHAAAGFVRDAKRD